MVTSKNINEFGIPQEILNMILNSFSQFNEIEEAILFGSRAKGAAEIGSDIDIALIGRDINFQTTLRLSSLLNEELPIPHHVDLANYNIISNQNLKDHINRVGKKIYTKHL
ncbi:MAG: nucleotidyltransferase domain-containing protein [Ginsengibacter sp.]